MAIKIKDIIDFYSGHEVSEGIKERVLERISNLEDDKEANAAFRDLWNKVDAAYMDEEELSTAYARFRKADCQQPIPSKRLYIFTWARVAAVVVPLLMLIAFAKIYVQMDNQLEASQAVVMIQEHTNCDEDKVIALQDGTKVKLSQSSVLLYPSSFNDKERKVFLAGEAFFDIKHNDKQPFHVSTPYFEITDLGTSFAVSSYTTDKEVSTTLKTGKIKLQIVGEDKIYSMNPNDQLIYNIKKKTITLHQVSKSNDGMSWKNKQIDLNDVTMVEATNIMSKVYGVKFSFRSPRYQNTKITVHFYRGESLTGAMTIIKNLIPGLKYEIKNEEVILE